MAQPISVHELLYPLLTAYDAVMLRSDVELGATEQKFNLLVHREIQREYSLPGQAILTMPILVGLDGQRKMSKSLGNYVGITEPPSEMFGKLMSIPDELMWSYYELLTETNAEALRISLTEGHRSPIDIKWQLAHRVVWDFHGRDVADAAGQEFNRVFRQRLAPEGATVHRLPRGPARKLTALLVDLKLAPSKAEAERLIKQKAVEIDGTTIDDPRKDIGLSKPAEFLLRSGKKKFVRVVVE